MDSPAVEIIVAACGVAAAAAAAVAAWRSNEVAGRALEATRSANEIAANALVASQAANRLAEHALESLRISNRIAERALASEEVRDNARRSATAARAAKILGDVLDATLWTLAYLLEGVDRSQILNPTLQAFDAAIPLLVAERDRPKNEALGAELVADLAELCILFADARTGFIRSGGGTEEERLRVAAEAIERPARSLHELLGKLAALAGAKASPVEPWDKLLGEKREDYRTDSDAVPADG
jgi:hypothetical protein